MTDSLVKNTAKLILPYAGKLVNLCLPDEERLEAITRAQRLPSIQLSERSLCDLELLATGAFSPLDRFMSEDDYRRVLAEMRLANGTLFPIPVMLPVDRSDAVRLDQEISLRDSKNEVVATLVIEEIFSWNLQEEAQQILATVDLRHPLVSEMHRWGNAYVSGPLTVLRLPRHYDFQNLRLTPKETRVRLTEMGFDNVVAFQTRNPLHRAHEEMTKHAMEQVNGVLLLHPVVGLTKPGDIDYYTRVRSYRALATSHYDPHRILLTLLPLAMRFAGPREALWHALIRRNYGANYLIVGRDHASPGKNSVGKQFYYPYAAQELLEQFSEELGIKPLSFGEFVYVPEEGRFVDSRNEHKGSGAAEISGTLAREWYGGGRTNVPEWFARDEVVEVIRDTYPPRHKQGFCVWFTGLSSAGKSTTAEILTVLLQEAGRQVTVLDGDVVRNNLSRGLGFSKADRDLNIRRIGFVAAEIVRHHGAVICAAVSPYRATRNEVRDMVGSDRFVEVFVDTPLGTCELRDSKGIYEKARRGELNNVTGIDDPYEPPLDPEIVIETITNSAEANALSIFKHLCDVGWVNKP